MKIWKYLKTGLKLVLVLALGSLIMLIPSFIVSGLAVYSLFFGGVKPMVIPILYIVFITIGLIVDGWLIIKYRNWIFKK